MISCTDPESNRIARDAEPEFPTHLASGIALQKPAGLCLCQGGCASRISGEGEVEWLMPRSLLMEERPPCRPFTIGPHGGRPFRIPSARGEPAPARGGRANGHLKVAVVVPTAIVNGDRDVCRYLVDWKTEFGRRGGLRDCGSRASFNRCRLVRGRFRTRRLSRRRRRRDFLEDRYGCRPRCRSSGRRGGTRFR